MFTYPLMGGGPAPFQPTDIPNIFFWLDPANPGVTPGQWDDVSGNGNHYTADGVLPTFAGGVATFNGINQAVSGVNLSALTEGEIFIKQKRYSAASESGTNTGWMRTGSILGSRSHFTYSGTVYSCFGSASRYTVGAPGIDIAAWHTANISCANNYFHCKLNRTTKYSNTSHTVSFWNGPSEMGSWDTYFFQGDMKAIIMYSRKLTTDERTEVEDYLDTL